MVCRQEQSDQSRSRYTQSSCPDMPSAWFTVIQAGGHGFDADDGYGCESNEGVSANPVTPAGSCARSEKSTSKVSMRGGPATS
jgi:hypothetical protein